MRPQSEVASGYDQEIPQSQTADTPIFLKLSPRSGNHTRILAISANYKGNPKRFWSYIKNAGQGASGVSTLKHEDGFLKSDSPSRANILNRQFESVFTKEDTRLGFKPTPRYA